MNSIKKQTEKSIAALMGSGSAQSATAGPNQDDMEFDFVANKPGTGAEKNIAAAEKDITSAEKNITAAEKNIAAYMNMMDYSHLIPYTNRPGRNVATQNVEKHEAENNIAILLNVSHSTQTQLCSFL
jgi:hypothetical protein